MKIETITGRLVSLAPSLMLIVCLASVGRTQQTDHDILSTADKNQIVASTLRIAFGTSRLGMALSAENLEFVDSTRMSEMGFTLVGAGQVQFFLDDFVAFKKIASRDGVVSVVVSRITRKRACFSRTVVSSERRTFTLEFHNEAGEWVGQLVPMLQLFEKYDRLQAKPNKSLDASRGGVFLKELW